MNALGSQRIPSEYVSTQLLSAMYLTTVRSCNIDHCAPKARLPRLYGMSFIFCSCQIITIRSCEWDQCIFKARALHRLSFSRQKRIAFYKLSSQRMQTKQYKQWVVQLNIHFTMMVENWAIVLLLYFHDVADDVLHIILDRLRTRTKMHGGQRCGYNYIGQTVAEWSLSLNSSCLCRHDDSMNLYHYENCHIFNATCRSSGKLYNTVPSRYNRR